MVSGKYMYDIVITTYLGNEGDSGAPVWGYTPTKSFYGIHSGGSDYISAFSKQHNIDGQ